MCQSCNKILPKLNPEPTENQIALFHRAKLITDTHKLAAMLPAWIKAHMKAVAPPKPFVFVPNLPPKYPAWTIGAVTVTRKMLLDFGNAKHTEVMLACSKLEEVRRKKDARNYIRLNGLRKAA